MVVISEQLSNLPDHLLEGVYSRLTARSREADNIRYELSCGLLFTDKGVQKKMIKMILDSMTEHYKKGELEQGHEKIKMLTVFLSELALAKEEEFTRMRKEQRNRVEKEESEAILDRLLPVDTCLRIMKKRIGHCHTLDTLTKTIKLHELRASTEGEKCVAQSSELSIQSCFKNCMGPKKEVLSTIHKALLNQLIRARNELEAVDIIITCLRLMESSWKMSMSEEIHYWRAYREEIKGSYPPDKPKGKGKVVDFVARRQES
jgi:hypothetical protein